MRPTFYKFVAAEVVSSNIWSSLQNYKSSVERYEAKQSCVISKQEGIHRFLSARIVESRDTAWKMYGKMKPFRQFPPLKKPN